MIEAILIRQLDSISQIFGVLVYWLCGLERHGPVTDVFTLYVYIIQIVCRLHGQYVMGPEYFAKIRADIRTYNIKTVDVFGNLQVSRMG